MVNPLLKTHYPFNGKCLDIGGLGYHYLDEGAGAPVVMVHGNPSWSFYYRNLVLALRDRYRCIVPDHIGCGLSDKPGDDRYEYTLSRRVDDLELLLETLGITENITLVVHDWGGMIGMAYAVRHPERIARLVILNTGAFHLPKTKPWPLGLRICRDTVLGTLLVRGFNAFSVGASYVGCKRNPMSPELRALYQLPYNSWQSRIACRGEILQTRPSLRPVAMEYPSSTSHRRRGCDAATRRRTSPSYVLYTFRGLRGNCVDFPLLCVHITLP